MTSLPKFLVNEFDTQKNPIPASSLTSGSNKKVWWLCQISHSYLSSVADRTKGTGCPYCAGKKVLVGFNDLATTHPQIALEWDITKNPIPVTTLSKGSRYNAWWLCNDNHSYDMAVKKRTAGRGCPYCAGKRILVGFNDLATTHPELAKEWDTDKNSLPATAISYGSSEKAWWLCSHNHSWQTSPNRRSKNNCPICSNKRISVGFNDLATTHPTISQEWHLAKNEEKTAKNFTKGSRTHAWWQCDKGHEWDARIGERTGHKTNCPECARLAQVSLAEKEIVAYLRDKMLTVETSNRTLLDGKEVDIYIPEKKIAIEFNGLYWHTEKSGKNSTYHYQKYATLKDQGIQLLQIWEDDWKNNKERILKSIDYKLGLANTSKIYARLTTVTMITTQAARDFLNEHHIQGFASGSYYIGLQNDSGSLLAVIVLRRERTNTLNIIRYATSLSVVGGFTKLLKYAEKNYYPDRFITFSDNCISDGSLYKNNGFHIDKELAPDYMYVVNHTRKHKFGFRIERFRNDKNLFYKEGMTEKELASLNNLQRIWDAGKIRWALEINR